MIAISLTPNEDNDKYVFILEQAKTTDKKKLLQDLANQSPPIVSLVPSIKLRVVIPTSFSSFYRSACHH